jgi:hypothetical protein
MRSKILQGLAIILIIEVGLVHYFSSQHEFEEAWILGYLFIGNFLGAFVAAYGIYRSKTWGWALGFFISAGSLAAYIWSRTTGLPSLTPEEWLYPWGVTSVISEGLFCILIPLHFWWARQVDIEPTGGTNVWRYVLPVAGLIPLILVNYYTYQWDANYPELDHEHVFFLWQVRLQPEISSKTLEDQYGLQVSRVAVSVMDSVVDVRIRVLDSEKAEQLLEDEHFALLVGDTLIPAPHIHRHMFDNRTIIVLFPNMEKIVKNGTPVSLVFEKLWVEPVSAN